jgi:hypothetical protein
VSVKLRRDGRLPPRNSQSPGSASAWSMGTTRPTLSRRTTRSIHSSSSLTVTALLQSTLQMARMLSGPRGVAGMLQGNFDASRHTNAAMFKVQDHFATLPFPHDHSRTNHPRGPNRTVLVPPQCPFHVYSDVHSGRHWRSWRRARARRS